MLRLGIIGCGRVTTMFHLNAIEASGVVELVSLADNHKEQLSEVKNTTGVTHVCEDYHDLLSSPAVDAVAINTPPKLHETMVLEALESKKHVLCEKPLAQTVEGCIRINKKKNDTNLVVLPAHNYSFTPALFKMEEGINQGVIGKVERLKICFENNLGWYSSRTDFRIKNPNGIIEDVMPHILSVALKIAGEPEEVDSVNWHCKKYDVCDNLNAKIKTKQGVELDCFASWTKMIPKFTVEIMGDKGYMKSDFAINPYNYILETSGKKEKISTRGLDWYLDLARFRHPSFIEQYRHFENIVKNNVKPRITIDDEISMILVMNKIAAQVIG